MNILFHCVYFPPEVGGLESHVFYLAKALVDLGHRVQVVTSRSIPGIPEEEELGGVQVYRTWFPSRSPAGWVAHALASIPKTRSLAKEADVIHAQAFASVLPAAWSLMLSLRAEGLGTTWTTLLVSEEERVAEMLGIPEGVTQTVLLPVAYTLGARLRPADRRPAAEVTYWNRWGDRR